MSEVSLEALRHSFQRAGINLSLSSPSLLCAVSGGLDSMVLVYLLNQLECPLRAIHIDHAVHPDSASWAQWVQQEMQTARVPLIIQRLESTGETGSLEEQWRNARRAAFSNALGKGDILVTAHHQDDQVETLLLQLLRGAGPVGLQAMPLCSDSKGQGRHLRPLLAHTRDELADFATQEGIRWLDDPSNADERFARNFLRHNVLPTLYQRWPGAGAAIARSTELIAESVRLNQVLAELDTTISEDGSCLDWSALESLDKTRQANAVRYWLQQCEVRLPSQR